MSAIVHEIDRVREPALLQVRRRRRIYALSVAVLMGFAFAALACVLLFILGFVLMRGGQALDLALFTTDTVGQHGNGNR